MQSLLLVGASGQAAVVLDVLALRADFEVIGLIDDFWQRGETMHGHHILGKIDNLREIAFSSSGALFFVAIGDNWTRSRISAQILVEIPGARFATIVHPHASIARSAALGAGTVVMAGAVVGTNCNLGGGCIINTSCSVDHDCVLADFSSIGPGAHLGGAVSVGSRSSIGIGASVSHRIAIGADTVVGAGAVVVKDLPDNAVAYGVPARVARHRACDERYL